MTATNIWPHRLFLSLSLALVICPSAKAAETYEDVTNESSGTQWIWSPAHTKDEVPQCECFFRKAFQLSSPAIGEIVISADNQYELFVNGQPVGQGNDWRQMQSHDVSQLLRPGRNCIAVHVTNTDVGSAGLAAQVLVKEESGTFKDFSSDPSWKTSVRHYQSWTSPGFPESEWIAARSYGSLGATLPWGDEIVLAGEGSRFKIRNDFAIERLMRDEEVGSLIAMAFDSQGNILVSREGGNLYLLTDENQNGVHDTVGMFCDQIKNVQGILPLGSKVFAIGDGPQGVCLYRISDDNRDGVAEGIQPLVPIRGSRGEHGAHAVRLGPDGLLYVILGDHARVGTQPAPQSPYKNWYEGDLVTPRYEDPQGHAVGIPAPGGTIFRTDENGSFVELVAGGLRNSYDFAFNSAGEIFTYDSDMEWDRGAPWYRPTRVNHVTMGAELGWRSGWAKWPAYYRDSLPAALNVGPGSPTGVEFYYHKAFPVEYRGAMFGCDWATGKIYCFRPRSAGASYRMKSEVFIEGRPLNATDIAVGPDGALYFCTGGRGTDGGVYRVRWTGQPKPEDLDQGEGIEQALRQPQFEADWAKAKIAGVMRTLGNRWPEELNNIVRDNTRPTSERLRALDLMNFFGPSPSEQLLIALTQEESIALRAKAVQTLAKYKTNTSAQRLVALLGDSSPRLRRVACESLMRLGAPVNLDVMASLLADEDRFVAFAAQKYLQQLPLQQWANLVLNTTDTKVFCNGALPLLANTRDGNLARNVLSKCTSALSTAVANGESSQIVNLLRVLQLAYSKGQISPQEFPQVGEQLLSYYPSNNAPVDRELVRLLVYLNQPGAAEKFANQVTSDLPQEEKLHLGAYAALLNSDWDQNSKLAFIKFYEISRSQKGGYSVSAYVENFARDFFTKLTLEERERILARGKQLPTSALSVIAKLPVQPGTEILQSLRDLDGQIQPLCATSDTYRRLRVGIFAVLGRSGDPQSMAYLRSVYQNEPEQRNTVAMALTQNPEGENWALLVDSLKSVDGNVAREVLRALAQVGRGSQEPEDYRQVILQGLRLGNNGAVEALQVLNRWSGQSTQIQEEYWQQQLTAWQQQYAQQFPHAPPAELPADNGTDKWSYEELLSFLENGDSTKADIPRGKEAFTKAMCIKCHRCGPEGETIGPDLTTIAQRFQRKEILESIVYPDHNISDQYAAKQVIANGRSYVGIVAPRGQSGVTVLLTDGEKVELNQSDIESIEPSGQSPMPKGLLNALTLQQVADLFAYLENQKQTDMAKARDESGSRVN